MLVEAFRSVADTGSQSLLHERRQRTARPVSEDRPFGDGRKRCSWSFVVALVLFLPVPREDRGALFGLVLALAGVTHAVTTGQRWNASVPAARVVHLEPETYVEPAA